MADKVVITKSKLDDLAQRINEKAGSSGAKTIESLCQTVDEIQIPNYRRYSGEITETVKGYGNNIRALLLEDSFLAEHFQDETLGITVTFELSDGLVGYTIIQVQSFNSPDQRPWNGLGMYTYSFRLDANASYNANKHAFPLNHQNYEGFVGQLQLTEDGKLYIYSASSNYAIRPSHFIVEVTWGHLYSGLV